MVYSLVVIVLGFELILSVNIIRLVFSLSSDISVSFIITFYYKYVQRYELNLTRIGSGVILYGLINEWWNQTDNIS